MRKSGRTFRKLLGALIKASGGNYVVYVSNTHAHLEKARLLAENCLRQNQHAKIQDNQIMFEGPEGGVIEFFTKDQYQQKDQVGYFRNRKIIDNILYDTH